MMFFVAGPPLLLAPPASAAPPFTLLGRGVAVTDQQRWVLIDLPSGPDVLAVDTKTGSRHRFSAPPGCEGGLAATGARLALFACGDGQPPRVVGIDGSLPPQATAEPYRTLVDQWTAIGSRWLQGTESTTSAGHVNAPVLFNWHTGAVRRSPLGAAVNLNRRTPILARRRRTWRPRYVIRRDRSGRTVGERLTAVGPRDQRVLLSRCHPFCDWPQVSAGFATWAQGRIVRVVRLADRRRWRWRATRQVRGAPLVVLHTRWAVFAEVSDRPLNLGGSSGFLVYEAPTQW